jgi:hypothetical protein
MEHEVENEAWIQLKTMQLMLRKERRVMDPNGSERWPGMLRQIHNLRMTLDEEYLQSPEGVYYKAHIILFCMELFRNDLSLLKKYKAHCLEFSKDKEVSREMRDTYLYMFHILNECITIIIKKHINKNRREAEQ